MILSRLCEWWNNFQPGQLDFKNFLNNHEYKHNKIHELLSMDVKMASFL